MSDNTAEKRPGKMLLVGFGPGSDDLLTNRARAAIQEANIVVGYTTYIELVRDLLGGKRVIQTGMQEEVVRAKRAVDMAEEGNTVAVISSGDAGVYGMAGLIFDVLKERNWTPDADHVSVEVVPGVSAVNAVAALLGAPLVSDFACISLSDYLTPLETIYHRLDVCTATDFIIALYNPKSGRRTEQIVEAQRIMLKYRPAQTPVGIVKSAYREGQVIVLTDLEHMLDFEIGMLTTIIIGNSSTYVLEDKMITPRGYQKKYQLTGPAGSGIESAVGSRP